jgi:hypothetical protein
MDNSTGIVKKYDKLIVYCTGVTDGVMVMDSCTGIET